MRDRDVENLYSDLSEKINELDVLLHDHGIEFLSCEDDCNEGLDPDILRLVELLKEAHLIIEENS